MTDLFISEWDRIKVMLGEAAKNQDWDTWDKIYSEWEDIKSAIIKNERSKND